MNQKTVPVPSALAAAAIIALYTLLSLFRLGYSYAPGTCWQADGQGEEILLDLGKTQDVGSLSWYLGNYEKRVFELYVGNGVPLTWVRLPDVEMKRVWQWEGSLVNMRCRYIKLITANGPAAINELLVKDTKGRVIEPANASDYPELFDEAALYPGYGSFLSGTVFDESVFARTAYEYLHGLVSFEDTHPPLGKVLISWGIACFGLNPFGYRVPGVVAGALLLAVIWVFASRLMKDSRIAVAVTALFALDFLHFTESRLGQTDSFLVLFTTSMYYFMYRYGEENEKGKRGWRFLGGSGFFFGLAVSCKWSGFYGGVGLALIWLAVLIRRFRREGIGWREVWKVCGISVAFFIIVPAVIYLLSYIPFVPADPDMGFLEKVAKNQVNMLQYHSGVGGDHGQASRWYEWPLSLKPIKLYSVRFPDGKMELVTLMGNPGLWWAGLFILFAGLYDLAGHMEGRKMFLAIAYGIPLVPWLFISRYTFLYHYYPSLPFLALMTGVWAEERGGKGKAVLLCCVVCSAALFVMFYPIISGMKVETRYVVRWLQWLPGWKFAESG